MPQPTKEKWIQIAQDFYKHANFPNCLGAIDGKHIRIIKPEQSGSLFYNYKCFFSIVVLAVCDSNYCFTSVDIGGFGKSSDSSLFQDSTLWKKITRAQLEIPEEAPLPGTTGPAMPHVFVADEAFGLSKYVMRPYAGKYLTVKKKVLNYRLTRARRYIECTFGILANKWRIFHRPLNVSLAFCEDIVKACVILHNFVRVRDGFQFEDTLDYEGFCDIQQFTSTNTAKTAITLRNIFADYFTSAGELEWQYSRI